MNSILINWEHAYILTQTKLYSTVQYTSLHALTKYNFTAHLQEYILIAEEFLVRNPKLSWNSLSDIGCFQQIQIEIPFLSVSLVAEVRIIWFGDRRPIEAWIYMVYPSY